MTAMIPGLIAAVLTSAVLLLCYNVLADTWHRLGVPAPVVLWRQMPSTARWRVSAWVLLLVGAVAWLGAG